MTLYIYRVGSTYPARNPFYRWNLRNSLITLGLLIDRSDWSTLPVRPVGCCRTDYSVWPVRLLGRTGQTGRYCRMPILVVNTFICRIRTRSDAQRFLPSEFGLDADRSDRLVDANFGYQQLLFEFVYVLASHNIGKTWNQVVPHYQFATNEISTPG